MLGQHDEVAVEIAIALRDVAFEILAATSASSGVTHTYHQCRHPLQSEFAFAEQADPTGEMAILVDHPHILPALASLPMVVEDCADIPQLYPPPKGYRKAILERIVVPPARRQRMLVQEVVRDHERPVLLHLRRRHLQQPRAAVRELRMGQAGAQQGECQGQEGCQEYVIVFVQCSISRFIAGAGLSLNLFYSGGE